MCNILLTQVRKMKKSYFPVKKALLTKYVLYSLADRANDEGYCWPSVSTICNELFIGRSTFFEKINELESLGFVKRITRTKEGSNSLTSNGYLVCLPEITLPATGNPVQPVDYPRPETGLPPVQPLDTKHKSLNIKESIDIGHSKNDRDTDNLFSDFYKAYPKKVKRDRALKVWESKQLWKHSEDIMANIEQRKKCQMHWVTCKGQQKQFIPAPDVYLNNKGWEDELELSHKDCKSCNDQKKSSVYDMGMG